MKNTRSYWQLTVSLVFSILATAAFIWGFGQFFSDAVCNRVDYIRNSGVPCQLTGKTVQYCEKAGFCNYSCSCYRIDSNGDSFRCVQNGWNSFTANLDEYVTDLITKISAPVVTATGNFAKRLSFYLISMIVAVLSAYFFTFQREEVLKLREPPKE